jgi:hypothetical protein
MKRYFIFLVLQLFAGLLCAQSSSPDNITCFGIPGNEISLSRLLDSLEHGNLNNFVKPVTLNTEVLRYSFGYFPADTNDPKFEKMAIGDVSEGRPHALIISRLKLAKPGAQFVIQDVRVRSYDREYTLSPVWFTIK